MKDKIDLKFVLCAVSLLLGLAIPIVESNDAEDMKKGEKFDSFDQ